MKKLRLMTMMALASGLVLAGCGDGGGRTGDDGGTEEDSDVDLMDSGPGGDDSGPGGDDSGPGGDDSGPGGDDGGSGGMCPDGDCNILTNDGCDVGQACQYLADGPTCVEAGLGGDDESCSGPTDCQEGFGCVGPSGGDTFCQPYCCGADGCPTGQSCNVDVGDGSGSVLFQVCEQPSDCDLVEQTGCDPGQGCYPSSMDGSVACDPAGSGTQGDTCESRSACESGFVCAGSSEPLTCAKVCDPTAGSPDCPGGTSCGGRLMGFPDDVGICVSDSG